MLTATKDAGSAIRQIRDQAEKIKSDALQRFPEAASPGDFHRQGDVYITLLEKLPAGVKRAKKPVTQLAPGDTQGSRHCLDTLDGVDVYELAMPGPLDGPVFQVNTESVTVAHPEHGDVELPGAGRCYGITYQRDLDAEERERRVQD